RMKDLLDKDLPVGTAIATTRPWKRYLLPIIGLFIAGGGGYAYHQYQQQITVSTTIAHNSAPANKHSTNIVPTSTTVVAKAPASAESTLSAWRNSESETAVILEKSTAYHRARTSSSTTSTTRSHSVSSLLAVTPPE